MVTSFADMIARYAGAGRVEWIGIRPERKAPVCAVQNASITFAGLTGDHSRAGKRAVTLLQAEHLAVIGSFLGQGAVKPEDLRRNILISGINLASLKNRAVRIGTAEFMIEGLCAPCSRMEQTFGHGGYAAVRGHGGWYARVLKEGRVERGDAVSPMQPL